MILPSLLIFSNRNRMAQAQERAPGHHDRPFSENRATTLRSGKTPRGGLIWDVSGMMYEQHQRRRVRAHEHAAVVHD